MLIFKYNKLIRFNDFFKLNDNLLNDLIRKGPIYFSRSFFPTSFVQEIQHPLTVSFS